MPSQMEFYSVVVGALLVLIVFGVLRFRRMSRNTLKVVANAPLPAMGDNSKITVWGYTDEPFKNAPG